MTTPEPTPAAPLLGEEAREVIRRAIWPRTSHPSQDEIVADVLAVLEPLVAALVAEARAAGKAEAEFGPLGDNHHNAARCPYCAQGLAALVAERERAARDENADPNFDQAVDWLLNHGAVDRDMLDTFNAIADGSITTQQADQIDMEEIRARAAANPDSLDYQPDGAS